MVVQCLRLQVSTARGTDLISGQGNSNCHAEQPKTKQMKKNGLRDIVALKHVHKFFSKFLSFKDGHSQGNGNKKLKQINGTLSNLQVLHNTVNYKENKKTNTRLGQNICK